MIQCTRCQHTHEKHERTLTDPDRRNMRFSLCPKCDGREYVTVNTKRYRPSNSTEGDDFSAQYCERCWKNRNQGCLIPGRTMLFAKDDPEYPEQWTYDAQGRPTCTAFLSFDDHTTQVKAMYQPRHRVSEKQMRLL